MTALFLPAVFQGSASGKGYGSSPWRCGAHDFPSASLLPAIGETAACVEHRSALVEGQLSSGNLRLFFWAFAADCAPDPKRFGLCGLRVQNDRVL